jgi:2-aminobenzoate-CoA ligase
MLGPTGHVDSFTRDRLPAPGDWPDIPLTEFDYPDWLNAGVELTDAMVTKGFGDHTALIGNGRSRTYKELTDWTNRLAHVLVEDYAVGEQPGHGGLLAGRDQGGGGRREHHADAAGRRVGADRRQGRDCAGAM